MSTPSEPLDFDTMDDAALAALDTGYADDTPTPEADPTPTAKPDEEPDTAPPAATEGDPTPDAGTEGEPATETPEEAEQRRVSVKEHQAMRQRAQQAEQAAQAAQQKLEAITQQQETQRLQGEYNRLLDEQGYEAAENFRLGVVTNRQQAQATAQQAEARSAHERVVMSDNLMRDTHADYDSVVARVQERLGADEAYRMAAKQPNPAKWAYEFGKTLETPAERAAAIKAEATKLAEAQVKAALEKETSPPKGQKNIGHLSSARSSGTGKDPNAMSEKELEAQIDQSIKAW